MGRLMIEAKKPGRPDGTIKRSIESQLYYFQQVECERELAYRRSGRRPSVMSICERLIARGGWHEYIACHHDHRRDLPITHDTQFGCLNTDGKTVQIHPKGLILLMNSVNTVSSARRIHSRAQKYIRDQGLTDIMRNRIADALGQPRTVSNWSIGWCLRPPLPRRSD